MLSIFRGRMPDITPAQLAGVLVAGIPMIATLLRVFGVFELSPAQIAALTDVVQWSAVLAGLLFVSDAGVRAARNSAESKVQAAAMHTDSVDLTSPPPVRIEGKVGHFAEGVAGPGQGTQVGDFEGEELLASDEEEFASPPVSALKPDAEADTMPEE